MNYQKRPHHNQQKGETMASEDTKLAGMRPETQLEATLTHHNRVLLNTLDSQQQRIAELEQALRALVADYNVPGWADRADDGYYACNYCHDCSRRADDYESIRHTPDCPVLAAKALLDKS